MTSWSSAAAHNIGVRAAGINSPASAMAGAIRKKMIAPWNE